MNERFRQYFKETFFPDGGEEAFFGSLSKPIKRTIRVNTNKVSIPDLQAMLTQSGYLLTPTFLEPVFYAEREEAYEHAERRLGFSLEHLLGYLYIQELGASTSVSYLSDFKRDFGEYLILDMASSPWGKTTQLSETYPKSFIVANEFERKRIPQLLSNIERMGCENIGVCNYNGQFIGRLSETFDKVLLDAPCSGEGIGFKSKDNLKHWNIKNIKRIAELQERLLEAGLSALKVGGELLYSTCTMNRLENEGVVDSIIAKHPGCLEIVLQRRFWPHIDATGGFFVCKMRKLWSMDYRSTKKPELANTEIRDPGNEAQKAFDGFLEEYGIDPEPGYVLKRHADDILLVRGAAFRQVLDRLYFFRLGKRIGTVSGKAFTPTYHFWRDYRFSKAPTYTIPDEAELDRYLRGHEIGQGIRGRYTQIIFGDNIVWIGDGASSGAIKNLFPKGWMRK